MSQSAISNRLNSNFGRVKDKELDLHTKLSIQAKQNALPKGNFITIASGLRTVPIGSILITHILLSLSRSHPTPTLFHAPDSLRL